MTNYHMIIYLELSCGVESHEPNTLQISSRIQSCKPDTPKVIIQFEDGRLRLIIYLGLSCKIQSHKPNTNKYIILDIILQTEQRKDDTNLNQYLVE